MLLLTIILLILFNFNLILYWTFFLKVKDKERKSVKIFYKIFPLIWTLSIVPIPIINLSFLKLWFPHNFSYFQEYWIFFALFGITLIIIGINFAKRARKLYKAKPLDENSSKLITHGIFRLIRHPIYSAWGIIFIGAAIISDSLISLLICPLVLIILEIHAMLEENLILIPKFGKNYENYKKKTPNRIIPTPMNLLLIIMVLVIAYVGFLNVN
ncbi:MAG: methyltransferase family protein [Candidatus Hodarchaeota archaeon]